MSFNGYTQKSTQPLTINEKIHKDILIPFNVLLGTQTCVPSIFQKSLQSPLSGSQSVTSSILREWLFLGKNKKLQRAKSGLSEN